MDQSPEKMERLLEAVRVRPNVEAIRDLKDTAEALAAIGANKRDRREAAALMLLLEIYDKIVDALA